MKGTTSSLNDLRDIVEPAAVSWWPLAPGWWIMIGIVATLAVIAWVKAAIRYRSNAYRREALRRLQTAQSNAELASLLKRTALSAFPRDEVASLSGERWCAWLEDTSGGPITDPVAKQLREGVFACHADEKSDALHAFVGRWIRQHQRPPSC